MINVGLCPQLHVVLRVTDKQSDRVIGVNSEQGKENSPLGFGARHPRQQIV
jgi:hypothetical protein